MLESEVLAKIENPEMMHVASTTEAINLSQAIIVKIRQGFRVQLSAMGDEAIGQMTKALSRARRKLLKSSLISIAWFSEELLTPDDKGNKISSAITSIVILNYFRPPEVKP